MTVLMFENFFRFHFYSRSTLTVKDIAKSINTYKFSKELLSKKEKTGINKKVILNS